MYNNFETLQSKCKKHYLHQKIKIALPIFMVTVIVAFAWIYKDAKAPNSSTSMHTTVQKANPLTIKSTKAIMVADEPKVKKEKKEQLKVEKPKIEEVKKKETKDIEYTIKSNYHYVPKIKHTQTHKLEKKTTVKKVESKKIEPKIAEATTQEKSLEFSSKNIDSLKEMLQLFKNKESYSLALKIGRKYYESKKYTEALQWGKKANILDKEKPGSWILYAQTQHAQGRKKRAIEILKLYLANKSSNQASILLKSLEKEE